MATQEESSLFRLATLSQPSVGSPRARVHVGVAPRTQPFDESMESLAMCVARAVESGIEISVQKVRGGVPGWQNWGPALFNLMADKDATHLFAAADDMTYPVDIIERLVSADKDIINPVYRKSAVHEIMPANWVEDAATFVEHLRNGAVVPCEFASGHGMLIKRQVIEKMIADYPELAYMNTYNGDTHYGLHIPMIKDGMAYHDDWAFSIRAKQSGFTIWNDYGCKCAHWGGTFLTFPDLKEIVNV